MCCPENFARGITDDNLWRPTRRAKEHYTKDKLSTRRGAVHSIGWLCSGRLLVAADLRRVDEHEAHSDA
jgi:hypothetical protein